MKIVTDSGTDVYLPAEEIAELNIHIVPLVVTLDGKTYREGVDIQTEEFYRKLSSTDSLPQTSQPSAGVFAELYRQLAEEDKDILSIHISSGLSGTCNAARLGASQVPKANVTVVDTKTLSAAAGWQVEAAARAAKAGWQKEKILALLEEIKAVSDSLYTLNDLKYLIHGGRISHMKGLIASILNIKPVIGVEKEKGTYVQLGQARSLKRAIRRLVELIAKQYNTGSKLRLQVLHAFNLEGAHLLQEELTRSFECVWLPLGNISLVLGAHTGPSMVAVAYAPFEGYPELP